MSVEEFEEMETRRKEKNARHASGMMGSSFGRTNKIIFEKIGKGYCSSIDYIYCSIMQSCFTVFLWWGKENLT